MDNVWVIRKERWYEMTGAFCGSLAIHALLFVILASTSIYYPATGEVAQFDILWVSPSTLPTENLAPTATPEVATAADITPEPTVVKPDIAKPPQIPLVEKNTEPPVQALPKQADEDPPVEMVAARATHPKQPSPPVKPPLKPKKTVIIIPKAKPEREKTTKTAAPPASAQAAKPEPVTRPEPPSPSPPPPPPPQPPLPPEKAVASIAEEQQMADISAKQEQQARENAAQQRLAAARKEHELWAAEAVRKKAEQQRKAAEAAKEKAEQERQAAEAARKKAEQQRLTQLKAEREQRAAARLQQEKIARQRAGNARIAAEKAERERLAAAEDRQRSEQERLASERVRLTKLAREREQAAAKKAVRERQAAEALRRNAEQQRASREKAEQVRLAALARHQAGLRAAEAVRNEQPKPRPAEKPPEARGIVIPSIHGDLKMIIIGSNGIKLTVMFQEYPKSRRNRGLTRSESRRGQKVTPIVVMTNEKTREAVIETAREGIYIFTAEPDGAPSATATFTLKSFEQSQRAKTQSLGAKTITGKAVVARVLMPEAILWEDESAFTGSMQDSTGVTKFNSDSGLIWKEYSD